MKEYNECNKYKKKVINVRNEDNDFQYFETLKRNRNKRHACSEFFVEGVRNINECTKNNWQVSAIIYSDFDKLSDWAKNILRSYAPENTKFYSLTAELMQKLSDKEDGDETSELIFIVKIENNKLSNLSLYKDSVVLIFDRPSNKGNLGTIIRTCDSFGVDALIVAGHAVDLYDAETVRATVGSFFKQKVLCVPSFREISGWIEREKAVFANLKVIGTSAKAEKFLHIGMSECEGSPKIIVIGNETAGMSRNFFELCDTLIKIPMDANSSASSLNVACAAAVILYEFTKNKL